MKTFNTTCLDPKKEFEKHVYHRDQFAHYLRWTHILKILKRDLSVLDWGCGPANLLEVIYRNRLKSSRYLGLEYKKSLVEKNIENFKNLDWAEFKQQDLCKKDFYYGNNWDIVCSLEVVEHIGKNNVDVFLENLKKHSNENTIILISTPCYDEKVGAAKNHIINGEVSEFEYNEFKDILMKNKFNVVNHWGTFASIADYEDKLNDWQKKFYEFSKEYFDNNILSNLMAPMFPENSRNVLWQLSIK